MTTPSPKSTQGNDQRAANLDIANQYIDQANKWVEQGASVEDVAAGLRHAAANFSAYAFFGSEATPKDPNAVVDNFIDFFEHYLTVHKPEPVPGQGLFDLVEQAKKELQ